MRHLIRSYQHARQAADDHDYDELAQEMDCFHSNRSGIESLRHLTMSKRDFFDPSWEDTNFVLIDATVLRKAQRWIKSCETCTPDEAQMPFDWVLDRVSGFDSAVTDYVLAEQAKCPRCKGPVVEKTLIDLKDNDGSGDGADVDLSQESVQRR